MGKKKKSHALFHSWHTKTSKVSPCSSGRGLALFGSQLSSGLKKGTCFSFQFVPSQPRKTVNLLPAPALAYEGSSHRVPGAWAEEHVLGTLQPCQRCPIKAHLPREERGWFSSWHFVAFDAPGSMQEGLLRIQSTCMGSRTNVTVTGLHSKVSHIPRPETK